ncbi:leucine-rich repeat domain-containing protein [Candidatus Rhabdochlamydia porcellionis]|jgi:Leucine-rich repeat (LRR) protein|uniref:Leucine rich repeat n=1 Tax=Candidatus Rhabdochlamydia porcellionis TaxID=225148 RepID=A0ABX8YZE1_9BACT|nr:leucine-rich repeat domain-containing protein [Candidatus Rhabdochlamydia porcellionis]QZA58699.1 Leucine rich repeat [Candidatus Rhabdochlamydia porcellionis]
MSIHSINQDLHMLRIGSEESISKKNLDGNELKKIIDQWVKDGPTDAVESLEEAKQRIFEFFNNNQETDKLLLSDLYLTSLPDIFHFEPFKSKLARLDISYNNLIILPESFGNLQALTRLNLSHNQLTGLPESFACLTTLKYLNLSHNNFTMLPDLLGDLQTLLQLDASYNYFSLSLPMKVWNLPSRCIIDLVGCNLSKEDLKKINKATTGPKIVTIYEEKLIELARKKLKPMSLLMQFT